MITDTCRCGAEFRADHVTASYPALEESRAHRDWMEAHASCRARPVVVNNAQDESREQANHRVESKREGREL